MICVEEPAEGLMLRRVELPQIKIPLLAREDPADEHNLDYINKPIGLFTRDWMHVCNPVTSFSSPHDRPVSFQDTSRVGVCIGTQGPRSIPDRMAR